MAVVQTVKLAATTAGGASADISVDAGVFVTVFIAATDGAIDATVQAPIKRKIGAAYKTLPSEGNKLPYLTRDRPEFTLRGPGVFQVVLPPTSEAVAVYEDR